MQKTPSKISRQIDEVVDTLNTRWNLQIPRLHGFEANNAGKEDEVSRKCSSRIRALCWTGRVNMEALLEEFEERAAPLSSDPTHKPSQERGTLLALPVTKSFLQKDAISKSRFVTPQNRLVLVNILLELLENEYKLAASSDAYERTSFTSQVDSGQQSFTSTRSCPNNSYSTTKEEKSISTDIQTPYSTMAKSNKKVSSDNSSSEKRDVSRLLQETSKEPKLESMKQQTIENFARKGDPHQFLTRQTPEVSLTPAFPHPSSRTSLAHLRSPPPQNNTSFETEIGEEKIGIWSDTEEEQSSNNTSVLDPAADDKRVPTQYSDGTQIGIAADSDPMLSFSLKVAALESLEEPKELLEELYSTGPFRPVPRELPQHLPYWLIYELYRVSRNLNVKVMSLWSYLRDMFCSEQLTFDQFWAAIQELCHGARDSSGNKKYTCPPKSQISSWTLNDNAYANTETGKSVSLSARLDFAGEHGDKIFDFEISSIKQDTSCRFHRHFGADRFMTLDLPYFETSLKKIDANNVHQAIFAWLTTNELHIAGRTWAAFWIEPSKKKRKDEAKRQKLHLFATDGHDFVKVKSNTGRHMPLSLLAFVEWHLQLSFNLDSEDKKLFARMQLGLSKTTATIVLEPHEFISVPDVPARDEHGQPKTDGTIMTDGCARMSRHLADDIWKKHGKPGQRLPSAFQARVSGAKGLWQVDYADAYPELSKRGYWIEIAPSQLKIRPHPRERQNADESQRTFEVLRTSSRCAPGHLNIQLINVLKDRGVPKRVFRKALEDDLAEYLDALSEAMNDPKALRSWRQAHHQSSAVFGPMKFQGGMPASTEDELDLLLESGFSAATCSYAAQCVKRLLKQGLDGYVDKLRIEIPHSTTICCVPDPIGKLKPGEVQLNFSDPKPHPATGLPEMGLRDLDVLVSRNPAYLASDVQKVRAVQYDELRHLTDVVIFPIQGEQPLADLLSGGDYDGDTVVVIWDPALVGPFNNMPKSSLATKEECGLVSSTKFVREIFDASHPTPQQLRLFMLSCCSFNGHQSKLGEITNVHESLIYSGKVFYTDPGPEKLAALAGYLVDSAKQGDSFSDKACAAVKSQVRGKILLQAPAYKKGSSTIPKKYNDTLECINIIDHLKFDVAISLRESVLRKFHENWGKYSSSLDEDVKEFFQREKLKDKAPDNSSESSEKAEDKMRLALLTHLSNQLEKIKNAYAKSIGSNDEYEATRMGRKWKKSKDKDGSYDFLRTVEELTSRFQAIEPLDIDCDIRREFLRHGGGTGSPWSLLKASCMHTNYYQSTVAWKLAGEELCRLKARKQGRTWEMTFPMRQYMKFDLKRLKKLADEDDDDDDNDCDEVYA